MRGEARPSLGRSESQMMLNAISLKSANTAVVHVDRQSDRHGAFRIHQPITLVAVDIQVIRDDVKLVTSHPENGVVINMHGEIAAGSPPDRNPCGRETPARQIENRPA